jgi:hypothetical protein
MSEFVHLLQLSFENRATVVEGGRLYLEMVRRVELTTNKYYARRDNVKAMLVVHGDRHRVLERQDQRYHIMYDLMYYCWSKYEARHRTSRLWLLCNSGVLMGVPSKHGIVFPMIKHLPVRGLAYYICVWRRSFASCETVLQLNQDYHTNFWAEHVNTGLITHLCCLLGVKRKLECAGIKATPDEMKRVYCKTPATHKYVDILFDIMGMATVELDNNTNKRTRLDG